MSLTQGLSPNSQAEFKNNNTNSIKDSLGFRSRQPRTCWRSIPIRQSTRPAPDDLGKSPPDRKADAADASMESQRGCVMPLLDLPSRPHTSEAGKRRQPTSVAPDSFTLALPALALPSTAVSSASASLGASRQVWRQRCRKTSGSMPRGHSMPCPSSKHPAPPGGLGHGCTTLFLTSSAPK